MPGYDKTGPRGEGPKTGGGRGRCVPERGRGGGQGGRGMGGRGMGGRGQGGRGQGGGGQGGPGMGRRRRRRRGGFGFDEPPRDENLVAPEADAPPAQEDGDDN